MYTFLNFLCIVAIEIFINNITNGDKMKIKALLALFLACSLATPVAFSEPPLKNPAPASQTDESKLTTHKHYTDKKGQSTHSPAKTVDDSIPNGASAKCRDGTYSFSRNHRGTCSHHGGVGQWLK